MKPILQAIMSKYVGSFLVLLYFFISSQISTITMQKMIILFISNNFKVFFNWHFFVQILGFVSVLLLCMNFIFYLAVSFSKSFWSIFQLTLLCSNSGFDISCCISVTLNNFAETKREQSLAFCLSITIRYEFYLLSRY